MNPEYRKDVRILYGDANTGMRHLYKQALSGAGFTQQREFNSLNGFADLLAVARPDIILMDVTLPGGDACGTIRAMRHSQIGNNPFLPVILTTWEAEQTLVRRIADSGADDALVKPLNTRTLIERIETIANARKPFVVTADYIGPDRRKAVDRGSSIIPLITVPNPLRAKLQGEEIDAVAAQQAFAAAQEQVQTLRLRQSAFRIAFVAQQVVPAYRQGKVDDGVRALLGDLIELTQDIGRRVLDTELAHVAKLCDPLLSTARQIASAQGAALSQPDGGKQLELLKTLADAVLAFFNPDKQASALAQEVASAVERYRTRLAVRQANNAAASSRG